MPWRRSLIAASAALLASTVLPALAAIPPISGRYQARPAGVLACGGLGGGCSFLVLEGWIDVETLGVPTPDGPHEVRIVGSDLRLVGLRGGSWSFPPIDPDLPRLEELHTGFDAGLYRFSREAGDNAGPEVHLTLRTHSLDRSTFLLAGSYFEGCCDRLAYDIRGAIFERLETAAATPLRLLSDRYHVEAEWRDHSGGSGFGVPVPMSDRAGRFWFFRPDNPELLVKIVPACGSFGRNWVFVAGLTDVGVTLRVTDTLLDETKSYENVAGEPFQPVLDTAGFPCRR